MMVEDLAALIEIDDPLIEKWIPTVLCYGWALRPDGTVVDDTQPLLAVSPPGGKKWADGNYTLHSSTCAGKSAISLRRGTEDRSVREHKRERFPIRQLDRFTASVFTVINTISGMLS